MLVDSPLALFTTLFGWQFYNVIWSTLLGTGLAILPFLGVLIETLFTEREDGRIMTSDPVSIYRRLEYRVLAMLFVVAFAAEPSSLTALSPDTIRHFPVSTALDPLPEQVTAAEPGNSFGDTNFGQFDQLVGDQVPVPIWWFTVLSISSGVNRAVINGFPEISAIRDMARLAQIGNISDPILRGETSSFFKDCYLKAKARYRQEKPVNADGVDISWIGSRFFLEDFKIKGGTGPIVYDYYRAKSPVQGFPYDENRDTEWLPQFVPEFGRPQCSDWWLGTSAEEGREGLRDELLKEVGFASDGLVEGLASILSKTVTPIGIDTTALEDRLIQGVLTRDPPTLANDSFGESSLEPGDGLAQVAARNVIQPVLTLVGVERSSVSFSLYFEVITRVMPMVQPMILMVIFALLPFALLASRYSLSFLIVGAIAIFTVNFWPVLWHMATWVDDNLILAMFPTTISEVGGSQENVETSLFVDFLTLKRGAIGAVGETKITLLNMVTASLFLLMPALFTVVMGWAGANVARSVGNMTQMLSTPGASAAASGPAQSGTTSMIKGGIGNVGKLGGMAASGGMGAAAKGLGSMAKGAIGLGRK